MTGFGRTGEAFAAQRFGVTPDMFTFAKGVTSAYVPLGGVAVRESLATALRQSSALPSGHTFSGHPLAMAAGVATLRAYRDEALFERAREIEGWLRTRFDALQRRHRIVGEARGVGAFFGLELVDDRENAHAVGALAGNAIAATVSSTICSLVGSTSWGDTTLRSSRRRWSISTRGTRRGVRNSRRRARTLGAKRDANCKSTTKRRASSSARYPSRSATKPVVP